MELYKTGIGIDIGGTKILAVLGTEQGAIVDEIKVDTDKTREGLLRQLGDIVGSFKEKSFKLGISAPQRIGIGLPGQVSERVVNWVPNLPELNGLELGDYADANWGIAARLQNDGQLALYGEQWLGAARNCSSVLMLTLGTGIGGGVMIGGKVWRGFNGTAGSMGWLTMDLEDEGNRELGWLERMVSGTAINRRASLLSVPLTSRELFEKVAAGDSEAAQLIEEIGHCIGTASANLASVFDPELILIGGGLSLQLDQLLPSMRKALAMYGSPSTRGIRITPAQLLDRAGVLGALRLTFL